MKDKDFINKKVDEIIQKALNNKDTFPTSKDLLKIFKENKNKQTKLYLLDMFKVRYNKENFDINNLETILYSLVDIKLSSFNPFFVYIDKCSKLL